MILILLGLLFSNTANAASLGVGGLCPGLVIKAGLLTQGDLTIESATSRYLAYLKSFVEQGGLGLEELKILRGSAKALNLAEVFSAKIDESYVYQEDIEKLLALVNHEKLNEEFDRIIAKLTLHSEAVESALKKVEVVTGFFPIKKKFIIENPLDEPEPHIDPHNGLFVVTQGKARMMTSSTDLTVTHMWNMETGEKKSRVNPDFKSTEPIFGQLFHIKERSYLFQSFQLDGNSHWAVVHDLQTGEVLLDMPIEKGWWHVLFLDSRQKPALAWQDKGNGDSTAKTEGIKIYFRQSHKDPVTELKLDIKPEEVHWRRTESGQLYALLKYKENEKYKTRVVDVSRGGETLFDLDFWLPGEFMAFIKHSQKDIFTVAFKEEFRLASNLISVKIKKDGASTQWIPEKPVSTPINPQNRKTYMPLIMGDDSLIYIVHSFKEPLIMQKAGTLTPQVFEDLGWVKQVFQKPNGEISLLIESRHSKVQEIFILDLPSEEVHRINMKGIITDRDLLLKGKLSEDGQITVYYQRRLQNDKLKEYFPVRIYGPFNPKTGEGAP